MPSTYVENDLTGLLYELLLGVLPLPGKRVVLTAFPQMIDSVPFRRYPLSEPKENDLFAVCGILDEASDTFTSHPKAMIVI
jgi:hypothetical protein